MKSKIILIFIDGIGLGNQTNDNPFYTSNMPFLTSLLSTRLVSGINIVKEHLLVKGIDASLGIDSCPPQSATGQTALLTGINAAKLLGYHLTAYPNDILIKAINEHNIFNKLFKNGLSATFANAYDTKQYQKRIQSGKIKHSVTTHCVMSAGLPFRTIDDLLNNNAVYWDITHEYLKQLNPELDIIDPYQAGQNLARLTNDHDFVLYECFLPDLIGHKRNHENAQTFLGIFDRFLEACSLYSSKNNTTILISSDHGNMEDLTTGGHTYNPVPLIAIGNDAKYFAHINAITDVCDSIVRVLTK
ncbi:MAG: hypothetical protein A2Y40_03700 [Candidatus Margulisbacteria bacterium GWF2_35_9]|nr:MAG: hypothetical protein A2Y40_03700 [Candidatus Margulisbacteria bacterium GWF2_35_9]